MNVEALFRNEGPMGRLQNALFSLAVEAGAGSASLAALFGVLEHFNGDRHGVLGERAMCARRGSSAQWSSWILSSTGWLQRRDVEVFDSPLNASTAPPPTTYC
jgi:hypothetical protein